MDSLLILVVIFILLEFYESSWQKSDTFFGLIEKNYFIYQKGIFSYLGMNPTFFYVIFLIFGIGYQGFWMISVFILKFIDILFRLYMMKKIAQNEDLELLLSSDMKMNIFLRYFNVIIYPTLFLVSTLN